MSKQISRLCCLAAALGLCLAVAGIPALGAEHNYNGVYTGNRLLTKGSGPMCSVDEGVTVTIHGQTLTFTDLNFRIVVLDFYPRQDGSFGLVYVDYPTLERIPKDSFFWYRDMIGRRKLAEAA